MVRCVALVVRGLLFLIQFRPKFGPIPDQLLFYRLCLAPVALPFSCRGGGLAERGKFGNFGFLKILVFVFLENGILFLERGNITLVYYY